jgi:hypothetical protein
VWTVNHVHDIAKFAALGVQAIVSDYPEKLCNPKLLRR